MNEIVEKPWGSYQIIDENPVTKILAINPGGMLSLQAHKHRGETWIPLDTGLIAYISRDRSPMPRDHEATLMLHGNTYSVPVFAQHRLINPTDKTIKLIEIMNGHYDEDDIVRFQDIYDRN